MTTKANTTGLTEEEINAMLDEILSTPLGVDLVKQAADTYGGN